MMEQHDIQELQNKVREASTFISTLRTEAGRIVVGQQYLIDRLILALLTDGHVLIEGLPGLAKTLSVKTLALAIGGTFSRIQFTPDLLPADVTGTRIYNADTHLFNIKQGPVFANVVLADEINRAPAKVQSALLEAMQERQVTIGGETLQLPHPFLVMATQNPIEQEGTYPLPEAQTDRFMFKLKIGYPSRDEERQIIGRMAHPEVDLKSIAVTKLADIINARQWADKIYCDEKIIEYILDIVIATRPACHNELSPRQNQAKLDDLPELIEFGASPRAAIALTLAAKGYAFMQGRGYVVPQDVKEIAPDILRHRIMISYEAEAEGLNSDNIIQKILDELHTP
ncbi:MAG: MoxR family ATPase [Victivallaceae bacterium]|nr:MoxR family ATPase [Victivallaceae bacterium]MDD3702620.1 MoxR family ATPase [Victivallaceae bacterium]MDD4317666.1 MoxR family ATPase [Victivallaceae bacterium]MDD5664233.1 MoxR family ATPase [Victivallaceae bacterium]